METYEWAKKDVEIMMFMADHGLTVLIDWSSKESIDYAMSLNQREDDVSKDISALLPSRHQHITKITVNETDYPQVSTSFGITTSLEDTAIIRANTPNAHATWKKAVLYSH